MKSWKEAAQIAAAIVGVVMTVSYGYVVTQQCQRVEGERPFALLAIDNARRIAVAVGSARMEDAMAAGSASMTDAVASADLLNSVRHILVSSNFPPAPEASASAVTIKARRGEGRQAASQPARGKIDNVVEYLSRKAIGWIVR